MTYWFWREILSHLSSNPQIVRILFYSAASSEHMYWLGLVARHFCHVFCLQAKTAKTYYEKHPRDIITDFGIITYWKWPIYFIAWFKRCDCFVIVQEDISSLLNSSIKPYFLPSTFLLQPSTDKEDTNKLDRVRRKTNGVRYFNNWQPPMTWTTSYETKPNNPTTNIFHPIYSLLD